MDESFRQLLAPNPSDQAEQVLAQRLCRGDVEALMELYDAVAVIAFTLAMALTRSRRKSVGAVRQAFLLAAEEPQVFCDRRISSRGLILVEVHHLAWAARHAPGAALRGSGRSGRDRSPIPSRPPIRRRHPGA